MKGLLRKELLALKSTFSILVIFVLVYAIIGVMGDNSSMVSGVLAVILMMLPANSISYDEFYHWDKYALTMPISRQKIVQSKYLLCFLLFGLFLVVGVTFSGLVDGNWGDALFTNLLVAAMSLLMSVIALPCMFKWGAQRGRLVIVLLCGVAGALIAILVISLKTGDLAREMRVGEMMQGMLLSNGILLSVALIVTAIATIISYRLSCNIFSKKQF